MSKEMNIKKAIKLLENKNCFWNNSEKLVLEAIETVLQDRERLQKENEFLETNYITLTEDVSKIGKKLGLAEDCIIDEIHIAITKLQR